MAEEENEEILHRKFDIDSKEDRLEIERVIEFYQRNVKKIERKIKYYENLLRRK